MLCLCELNSYWLTSTMGCCCRICHRKTKSKFGLINLHDPVLCTAQVSAVPVMFCILKNVTITWFPALALSESKNTKNAEKSVRLLKFHDVSSDPPCTLCAKLLSGRPISVHNSRRSRQCIQRDVVYLQLWNVRLQWSYGTGAQKTHTSAVNMKGVCAVVGTLQ